jgi:AraC-like DNA-binding protein
VNAFRVKYAKNLLLKTDDTIEDIFQVSGFQSRTTFWRAFAQIEGCTPKEFRRRAAQNYLSSLKSLKELSENNL